MPSGIGAAASAAAVAQSGIPAIAGQTGAAIANIAATT
jgi:hypothetical protein